MSDVIDYPARQRRPSAPAPPPAYAEFAVTSNFSFLRGASHPEELVDQAQALGLSGMGIADRNSVAGVVRAHVVAKERGFRIAVGARLCFADGTPDILAYPSDRAAWGRLTQLLSKGKRRAEKGDCILHLTDLIERDDGPQAAQEFLARQLIQRPSVRGESVLLDKAFENPVIEPTETLKSLKQITDQLLVRSANYRCRNCGFGARSYHCQCPSCKSWGTVKPLLNLRGC